VRRRYLKAAGVGASSADRRFLALAAKDPDVSSVALAARVYAMSVVPSRRADAYAACAYVLSVKESSR
jgi:hypothetical protein